MTRHRLAVAAALLLGLTGSARAEDALAPRVLVIPLDGKGPPAPAHLSEVLVRAVSGRGARASLAETGLAETALLVGCDPAETACLDAMASALNVDHLVFGTVRRRGRATVVELTVTARERPPARATVEVPTKGDPAAVDGLVTVEVTRLLETFDLEARVAAAEAAPAPAPEPAPPPPPPPPPPPVRPRSGHVPLWTWSLLAGGVAVAAAGGAVWGSGMLQRGDIDDAPTGSAAELEDLRDLEDDTELRLRVGGAMAIAGAAVTVTATVLVFRARGHTTMGETAARSPRAALPTIAATPLPGGAALTILGRF